MVINLDLLILKYQLFIQKNQKKMNKKNRLTMIESSGLSKKQLQKIIWSLQKELKELKERYEN